MIDTKNFAFPKPGHRDGAVKLSAYRYRKHKEKVWERQGQRCRNCRKSLPVASEGHLHHPGGRGIGGGRRNDLKTFLLCPDCHQKEHE